MPRGRERQLCDGTRVEVRFNVSAGGASRTLAVVPEDGRCEEIDVAKNVGTSLGPLGGARIRVQVQHASEAYRPCERVGQPVTGAEVLGDPSFSEPVGEQPGGVVGGA